MHIELLLEEPSAEAFFAEFLPKIVPEGTTWKLIPFQGKADLLNNLEKRLKGYASWIPDDWRIIVLVDEDREDCVKLKLKMEAAAKAAKLVTKSRAGNGRFNVLNRIAVEELEAWFLGDVEGLCAAYPGVPASLGNREKFRDPDALAGGTWEALERVLQRAGHFRGGLGKIELARTMGRHLEPERNRSRSFRTFVEGMMAL
jgi:hypothetical protein